MSHTPSCAWAIKPNVCGCTLCCCCHCAQGTFADLDGGSSLWAFECLTGNYVFKFKLEGNAWKRYDLVHPKEKNGKIMLQPAADSLSYDDMFATLSFYVRKRSVVGASTGAGSDKENINGIVQVRGPAGGQLVTLPFVLIVSSNKGDISGIVQVCSTNSPPLSMIVGGWGNGSGRPWIELRANPAAGVGPDVHLDKLGCRHGDERDPCLPGDSLCKQSLTGA